MEEGKGEEYCLEFGQVLLQHVTHLEGQGPQEEWVPGLPVTASAWSWKMGKVAPDGSSCTKVVGDPGGPPGPSLGNRWFTKKCQEDASIKKERCVYSMISTDQMHIHRMKVKPVSDSRVWPTLRHQRRGVEWVLMAHVTSPRAPIIKLKKKGGVGEGAAGSSGWVGSLYLRGLCPRPQTPVPASSPGPSFPGI